jgi:hypothetical protein
MITVVAGGILLAGDVIASSLEWLRDMAVDGWRRPQDWDLPLFNTYASR